jgi:hypothetical protein
VSRIEICPNCLRSLVVQETDLRLTVEADTLSLTPEALAKLRNERKALRLARAALEIKPPDGLPETP